jgi:RNA polymerase sigma-70 factor, ECF subfamily
VPSPQPTRWYQLQAAINAVHTDGATAAEADSSQIVALYDELLAVMPTPVAALNRAIAIGEVHGQGRALTLMDELDLDLDNYYAFHATRADLLRRLGRDGEAAAAHVRAAALAPTEAERDFLKLGGRDSRQPRATGTIEP